MNFREHRIIRLSQIVFQSDPQVLTWPVTRPIESIVIAYFKNDNVKKNLKGNNKLIITYIVFMEHTKNISSVYVLILRILLFQQVNYLN